MAEKNNKAIYIREDFSKSMTHVRPTTTSGAPIVRATSNNASQNNSSKKKY